MMPLYIMLCGLPGSGKSTLAAALIAVRPEFVLVSSDAIIEAEAAKRGATYDDIFQAEIDNATKAMNEARKEALKARRWIIHDQTNLSANSRAKKLSSVARDYCRVAVVCEVDDATRWQRMGARLGKTIARDLDASMKSAWQPPTLAEDFDAVMSARVAVRFLCDRDLISLPPATHIR